MLAGETGKVIVVLTVDVARKCGYPTEAGTTYQCREAWRVAVKVAEMV